MENTAYCIKMKNIGIFASVDPLTLDKTLLDKFENWKNIEKKSLLKELINMIWMNLIKK